MPIQDQLQLPSNPVFPSTRYQGSKAKLSNWIWNNISNFNFVTMLDAFGGTGVIGYKAKVNGKQVTYNDILRFNYYMGIGLIQNSNFKLDEEDINWILSDHSEIVYDPFVQETFQNIYFTDEENHWIDRTMANIMRIDNLYKFSLAFFALCQACIVKRPYNLFHRKNLYLRLANVERSFGNKRSWDRPFKEWFLRFVYEINSAVFDNGKENTSLNLDAIDVPGSYDLVYIDTPYISDKGVGINYLDFYHFLEGLAYYYSWDKHIDYNSKHRRFIQDYSPWNDKNRIIDSFNSLFRRHKNSKIVVSYRSDGIPTEEELLQLLSNYKSSVRVEYYGKYTYALSKNGNSREILLIGE